MKAVHGLCAQACSKGRIALVSQLGLDIGNEVAVRRLLTLDTVAAHHDAGHFYLGSRLAYAELHRREVAHFGARVARAALFDRCDHVIEPGLRIAYCACNDAVATQCERRHAVDGTLIHRRPREAATASYVMRAESPLLRHEHILRSYRHAARRAPPNTRPV